MGHGIPDHILDRHNRPVLDFVHGSSAHSDVAEALMQAVGPLADVQVFCPDPSEYGYVVVSVKGIIFGFATGMNTIAFRLNSPFAQRALETGGKTVSGLGDEWVKFTLFQNDRPEVDLLSWAQKAYAYARETTRGRPFIKG